MDRTNQTRPEVMAALDLKPIDVYYPCAACRHEFGPAGHADVNSACQHVDEDTKASDCICPGFLGVLEDGKPRAVRCRQLSPMEWSSMRPDKSLPLVLLPKEEQPPLTEEMAQKEHEWARSVVCATVRAVRTAPGGQERWRALRVVPGTAPNYDAWEVSIDDLDEMFSNFVWVIIRAIIEDWMDGGPFGGLNRPFRREPAPHVSHPGSHLREDTARVVPEPA